MCGRGGGVERGEGGGADITITEPGGGGETRHKLTSFPCPSGFKGDSSLSRVTQ